MTGTLLRALVDLRDRQIQKARIQFELRLSAIERQADLDPTGRQQAVLQRYFERFTALEKELDADISDLLDFYVISEHLSAVKGIGPTLSAKLISMIDIRRAETVSSLWRFAGYGMGEYWQDGNGKIIAPTSGFKWVKGKTGERERVFSEPEPEPDWVVVTVRDRSVAGWQRKYNARLKTACYLIGTSFLRSQSPYADEFYRARERYQQTHSEWTDGHRRYAAMGNMIKLFLAHLWERWRTLEGLPVRPPYCAEYGGHTSLSKPEDYGWLPLKH